MAGFKCLVRDLSCEEAVLEADARSGRLRQLKDATFELLFKSTVEGETLSVQARISEVTPSGKKDDNQEPSQVRVALMPTDSNRKRLEALVEKLGKHYELFRTFTFQKRIYYGDTNIEGNAYFARYFEWQGMAREEFYRQALTDHDKLARGGIHIITARAGIAFKSQLRLFDMVAINIRVSALKAANLTLVFQYKNQDTGQRVAVGSQDLTFADGRGRVIMVPEKVRSAAYPYYNPYEDIDARL